MATTTADVGARSKARSARAERPPGGGNRRWQVVIFLAPAALFIGALIIYPLVDTIAQSLQNDARQFVGVDNYKAIVESERIKTAIQNTAVWVILAPGLITGFGVIVAVLTERVSYSTAIKLVLFMPFAISGLAAGVLWRITYEPEPERGIVNAAANWVVELFDAPGLYPSARPLPDSGLTQAPGGGYVSDQSVQPGDTAALGLVAITDPEVPKDARGAQLPQAASDEISVLVWRDFKPGGGQSGEVEEGELALPGAEVALLDSGGEQVASENTGTDGVVTFSDPSGEGPYQVKLAATTFDQGFEGINWLGPSLVTPALIGIFFWASVGFAVVVIGGGLSALPRDLLEAARVDGGTEWQVFRLITVPLLMPVLGVVFISTTITVLKMFDLVWVTAPGASQDEANVIAVEMFRTAFAERNFGVGAAVAVLLFVLVIPIMILNLRQFRREG
ncbi:MAG: ABC transporter permease subunit [Actinomycetota bacterium]